MPGLQTQPSDDSVLPPEEDLQDMLQSMMVRLLDASTTAAASLPRLLLASQRGTSWPAPPPNWLLSGRRHPLPRLLSYLLPKRPPCHTQDDLNLAPEQQAQLRKKTAHEKWMLVQSHMQVRAPSQRCRRRSLPM